MEKYPDFDIIFPAREEANLHEAMLHLAALPWSSREVEQRDDSSDGQWLAFKRDAVGNTPACGLFILRRAPGKWNVPNIVPEKGEPRSQLTREEYKEILVEFETRIAGPAAEAVGGMTAREYSVYRLEDYFSKKAVSLLESFCKRANAGDHGSHPLDQERWRKFLLQVFEDKNQTSGDVMGYCLKTTSWWPHDAIPDMAAEYDFAMELLNDAAKQPELFAE